MDLPKRCVCFFVLFGVLLSGEVFSCDVPSGERTKCKDASSREDCPKTCCFDRTTTPNCYFQKSAYGPIRHSNGLCINVKDDEETLIWSRDCSSANAFFLVSYHYPPYHVATGKCVLPLLKRDKSLGDPGNNAVVILKSDAECNDDTVTFRPWKNGNLEYYYSKSPYKLCIGDKSNNGPRENEKVFIPKSVCSVDNNCELSYVYERKFSEEAMADFKCEFCSRIKVIRANYGVQVLKKYPFQISRSNTNCVATDATSVMETKCNEKTRCSFKVQSNDFLKTSCSQKPILLVRYTCIPAPPQATGTKSATSFHVKLRALQNNDSYVQIVVSKQKQNKKPISHPGNDLRQYVETSDDNKPYITAEIKKDDLKESRLFTVGDNKTYKFHNVKLEPDTYYSVFQRTFKRKGSYYDSDWIDVIKTDKLPSTTKSSLTERPKNKSPPLMADDDLVDKKEDGDSAVNIAIIGIAAGGGVLLIVLVVLVTIFVRRRKNRNSDIHLYEKPMKNTKPRQKDLNEQHADQTDLQSSDAGPEENPNVFTAPSGDVYAKPIKNRPPQDSEDDHGLQNHSYSNMQDEIPADESNGVQISSFISQVEEMKKNKNNGFQNEFKELPAGQIHPWNVGKMGKNAKKNKFGNNTAYDHSRVVLSGVEDYINANLIQGVQSEVYIAAQGPSEETVNDFWRMIWEKDCTCIIALANIVELGKVKFFQYWGDDETSFGEIHVKTVKTQLFADFTLRFIDIKKDGKGKKIIQYHFTSWPDHGVPKYPTKLLSFRHRFRALHTVSTQPIVVHCSAGVGRTGTFIALDTILLRLDQLNEQTINIKETIKELRDQRVNMVQTLEQYIFLYDAVLEMVLCGFTEIAAENLNTEIERLEQEELTKSLTGFEIEFKNLASACQLFTREECKTALLQENKSKNRDSKIYPTENLRVYLCGSKKEQDPYINATYVHSYTQARAYIATQAPLPHTINDFWQMVFEQRTAIVVMLNNISEGDTIYPQYWPEDFNEEEKYGDLFVKMVSAETRGPMVSRKFVITNTNKKATVTEHVVRHVQFTDWPENGVPENHSDVVDLLETVETQQRSANGAVIIHCSNGAHRTGTYLTLAIQRERVNSEHVIDIFRCVKMLREQRPQFVGNLEQYKFCYYAMLTFVESFKTYDNIPKVQKEL